MRMAKGEWMPVINILQSSHIETQWLVIVVSLLHVGADVSVPGVKDSWWEGEEGLVFVCFV